MWTMKKTWQKKIYKSLAEVEKEFFPVLYKERLKGNKPEEPKDIGKKIARDILDNAKQQILR